MSVLITIYIFVYTKLFNLHKITRIAILTIKSFILHRILQGTHNNGIRKCVKIAIATCIQSYSKREMQRIERIKL